MRKQTLQVKGVQSNSRLPRHEETESEAMITLCLGVPKSGKSLALQDLVREGVASGLTFAAFDHAFEWSELDKDGNENIRWRGAPPPITHVEKMEYDRACELLEASRDSGEGELFVFAAPWTALEVAQIVRDVGDCSFVDDEIDLIANTRDWETNPLREFIHRGRHSLDRHGYPREIHAYGAARRIQYLHTDLTSLANQIFVFRLQGSTTLTRAVKEGFLEESMVNFVRKLPDLHYVKWTTEGHHAWGRLKPL